MFKSTFTVSLALCLGVALVSWVCASDRKVSSGVPPAVPSLRLTHYQLPYDGFGSVAILDDGSLIVELGGEEILDSETGEWLGHRPLDVLFLNINVNRGMQLYRMGRFVFLGSSDGSALAQRGLDSARVSLTSFKRSTGPDETAYALYTFTGRTLLQYDAATRRLHLVVDDTDHGGLRFEAEETLGVPVRKFDAQETTIPNSSDDGPALLLAPVVSSSVCSANCEGGSCSISCGSGGCRSYCDGRTPVCRCGA